MAVKLRLQRFGKKRAAFYRIVATESTSPRDGKFISIVGTYNPNTNPASVKLEREEILNWLKNGAKPTDTVRSLLSKEGIMEEFATGVKTEKPVKKAKPVKKEKPAVKELSESEKKVEERRKAREAEKAAREAELAKELEDEDDAVKDAIKHRETHRSFAELVVDTILQHTGEKMETLISKYDLNDKAKGVNREVISEILKADGDLENDPRWDESELKLKTIPVKKTGSVSNPISFPAFKFTEIAKEDWKTSKTRIMFKKYLYVLVVIEDTEEGHVLKDCFLWHMENSVIEGHVKETFLKTVELINSGDVIKEVSEEGVKRSNLPDSKFNGTCFVRAHAQSNDDTNELPVADKVTGDSEYTKQSFWLTQGYIKSLFKN